MRVSLPTLQLFEYANNFPNVGATNRRRDMIPETVVNEYAKSACRENLVIRGFCKGSFATLWRHQRLPPYVWKPTFIAGSA
jgi:hypothetical protein